MLSFLALAAIVGSETYVATDDVCGYPHIPEQVSYEYLLVWGDGVEAVGTGDPSAFEHSMSYVQFDLKNTDPTKVVKATLVLTHFEEPTFTKGESEDYPLQVRLTKSGLEEKRWNPNQGSSFAPKSGKESLLAEAVIKPAIDGKPFAVEIELDLDKVKAAMKAGKENLLCFALTSAMDPEGADGTIYKFYSRSANSDLKPKLVVETSD